MIDQFPNLPAIIAELQDGGLSITNTAVAPRVLVLGTSNQGPSEVKVRVERDQESDVLFGREGNLVKGMFEARGGGSVETFLYRINTRSAILLGVGTDNQVTDPTSIETVFKDGSAADVYLVRYTTPASIGPNAILGRLIVKNALGTVVYDNNPGGTPIDLGEVIVSGTFDAGSDIGALGDPDDFVSMRDIAGDATAVVGEATAATYVSEKAEVWTADVTGLTGATFDVATGLYMDFNSANDATSYYAWFNVTDGIAQADPAPGGTGIQVDILVADTDTDIAGKLAAAIDLNVDFGAVAAGAVATITNAATGPTTDATAGTSTATVAVTADGAAATPIAGIALANDLVDGATLKVYVGGSEVANSEVTFNDVASPGPDTFDLSGAIALDGAVTVDYEYDSDEDHTLRDGRDGVDASLMEKYEALQDAYRILESDEVDIVLPMDCELDAKNLADGDTVVLSSDASIPVGERYPVKGSSGDALGKLHMEEYEGSVYYFWDIDDDGDAEIYPSVGLASATTKIDGSALTAADFKEVNFAYQLANFCFRLTVNDNFAIGVIGTSAPASSSSRDVARWLGKLPVKDPATGEVVVDGEGLLGNKFMAGRIGRSDGFFATFSGNLPTGNFDANSDVIKDRGGSKVDIGKYLSVTANPLLYFNDFDTTGFGFQDNMAAHYAGFVSTLELKSAPTNKTLLGVRAPFRLFRPKLNELSGLGYVTVKEKEGLLRVTDAATAAREESDYRRLTTVRIVSGAIDIVREVGTPYIGEPNTKLRREALQTSLRKELADFQTDGNLNRFTVNVVATPTQVIQGDMIVELELVPAFETRKITVITSLAAV